MGVAQLSAIRKRAYPSGSHAELRSSALANLVRSEIGWVFFSFQPQLVSYGLHGVDAERDVLVEIDP